MTDTVKILQSYITQYPDPIILKVGQEVILGEEKQEEKWKGWIFATSFSHAGEPAQEQKGWVPLQILHVSADRKSGTVLENYSAKELDVETGDSVQKLGALNGWTWCKNLRTNDEGWIPNEVIE